MADPVDQLLIAESDAALRDAVAAVGGFDRARDLLFERAYRLQIYGGRYEKIRALVDACDRIEVLARRTARLRQ